MTETPEIPQSMPVLKSGGHGTPSEGACVMEYISLLTGDEWTDFPLCTEPVVARAAQIVNDFLPDGEREEFLVPIIGRIMNARPLPEPIESQEEFPNNRRHYNHSDIAFRAARYDFPRIDNVYCTFEFDNKAPEERRRILKYMMLATLDRYDELAAQHLTPETCALPVSDETAADETVDA